MGDRRRTRFGRIRGLGRVGLALSACGAVLAPFAVSAQVAAVEDAPVGGPTGAVRAADLAARAAAELPQRVGALPDLDQPTIWPAADVVFATPEEAAADFVSNVLISEGSPVLGEFQQGDTRSGEIAVLFAGETGDLDPPLVAGVLQLRQSAPTDGWYVIGAASDGAVIDSPSALEEVPAGSVTVSGEGRGFEGTLAVSAFPPGDDAATFDLQFGTGGAAEDLQPYSVALDLSGAPAGEVVAVLVHGDTGLGSDPGTFAAIPIVIESASTAIPPTR